MIRPASILNRRRPDPPISELPSDKRDQLRAYLLLQLASFARSGEPGPDWSIARNGRLGREETRPSTTESRQRVGHNGANYGPDPAGTWRTQLPKDN